MCWLKTAGSRGLSAFGKLILSDAEVKLWEIAETNITPRPYPGRPGGCGRQVQKIRPSAMPAVDNENRLVGIITIDDVLDIVE